MAYLQLCHLFNNLSKTRDINYSILSEIFLTYHNLVFIVWRLLFVEFNLFNPNTFILRTENTEMIINDVLRIQIQVAHYSNIVYDLGFIYIHFHQVQYCF